MLSLQLRHSGQYGGEETLYGMGRELVGWWLSRRVEVTVRPVTKRLLAETETANLSLTQQKKSPSKGLLPNHPSPPKLSHPTPIRYMAALHAILTQDTGTVRVQKPYNQPGGDDFGFDLPSLGPNTSAGNTETSNDFGFDGPQPMDAALLRGTEDFGMDSNALLPPEAPQSAGIGAVPLPEADEDFGMDEAQEPLHSSPKARGRS
jgi:hypothetical protein